MRDSAFVLLATLEITATKNVMLDNGGITAGKNVTAVKAQLVIMLLESVSVVPATLVLDVRWNAHQVIYFLLLVASPPEYKKLMNKTRNLGLWLLRGMSV